MSLAQKQQETGPAYRRIEKNVRERIAAGVWPAGAELPTRKDLAREYGVAVATVERAIAGLIEDGTLLTRGRWGTFVAEAPPLVLAPLETKLFYSSFPSVAATIGIIVPLSSEFRVLHMTADAPSNNLVLVGGTFWQESIASSIERAVCARGGSVRFANAIGSDSIGPVVQKLMQDGVQALAVINIYGFLLTPLVQGVREALCGFPEVPLTFVSQEEIDQSVPHVFYDQQYAGYEAAEHLVEAGYRRLVFFAPFSVDWVEARISGARLAVRHAEPGQTEFTVFRHKNIPGDCTYEQASVGYEAAQALFAQGWLADPHSLPAALIAANDTVALGIYRAAKEQGLEIGRDFGLIGFDDHSSARMLGLTTLRPPLEQLGEEAAQMLLAALSGQLVRRQVRLHSHFISRTSMPRR